MKRLVKAYAQHFATWLMATATFISALDVELQAQHLFADALLEIIGNGVRALLHIEFQTDSDPNMEIRLMEYNMLASRQYGHCPVTSYVIYLRKDADIATSPSIRPGVDGEEVHRFHFRVIKLWEVPAEEFLRMEWLGLLPLMTLTRGGKRPEVVQVMIDRLAVAGETDLLALAQLVGGLAFKTKREQEWFKRRFTMFQDILRESWVYQEIGQQFLEEGRKEGREEGREEERQRRAEGQRELLMSFVQAHFPEITVLAKQQAEKIIDPEVLQHVIIKLLAAQGLDEAKRVLLDVNKSENRH